MARKRDLSPGLWRSAQFLELPSDGARLTFVAMISLADDLGVGLVSDLGRMTGIEGADDHANSVAKARLAVVYAGRDGLDRRAYYLLPKWCRYQYVNRPSKSSHPLPAGWEQLVPAEFHARYEKRVEEAGVLTPVPGDGPESSGRLTEDSVSPHGELTELHGAPSPSPSPIENSSEASPPQSSSAREISRTDASDDPDAAALLESIQTCQTKFLVEDPGITHAWAKAMIAAHGVGATPAEVRRADAWCQSHPRRTARRKSATRFLGGWFGRAAEGASPRSGAPRSGRMSAREILAWGQNHQDQPQPEASG